MNIPYAFRKCNKCGEWLVVHKINFHKQKNGKYGLRSICKKCIKKTTDTDEYRKKCREYYHTEHGKEVRKAYEKTEKAKAYRKSEKAKESHKKYYNSDKGKEYYKKYHKSEKSIAYEQSEQRKLAKKNYYKNGGKEASKKYYESEKGQVSLFNNQNKRRSRESNQGKSITVKQWKEVYKYFNWSCAYSEVILSKENRNLDHIIPLSKGGSNNIWNMIPMLNIYNFSKQDKLPLEWYKKQEYFSEERLAKIVEWQQYAYDKWATEEDDELILITDLK